MKILFAASEVNPIIKVGGIADVVSSLCKRLKESGQDVRIVIPFYQPIKDQKIDSLKKIASFSVVVEKKKEIVNVFQTEINNGVIVYLLENEKYLSNGGVYLDSQDFSYIARFLFFSVSILEIFKAIDWRPDVIHCHDWQTGIIPLLLKVKYEKSKIKTLFTIHNLLVQGRWNYNQILNFLELNGDESPHLKQKTQGIYGDDFNIMQQAILSADLITTVSPTYAKEIKTKIYYSRGLADVIHQRRKDIYGILNGIDIDIFNPRTDSFIKENYSYRSLKRKYINKLYLQNKAGLKQGKDIPLFAMISRLDIQKGVRLVSLAVDKIVDFGGQIIFLGTGEKKYESMLLKKAKKHAGSVAAFIKFDAKLAQEIYAGADIFLMPSRFEPCGLSQLISMRYGTIPIVRATGGLKDTVNGVIVKRKLFSFKKVKGTGFLFYTQTLEKFTVVIKKAVKLYSQKKLWKQLQVNAMKQDFSWRESAKKYLELYKKLINI